VICWCWWGRVVRVRCGGGARAREVSAEARRRRLRSSMLVETSSCIRFPSCTCMHACMEQQQRQQQQRERKESSKMSAHVGIYMRFAGHLGIFSVLPPLDGTRGENGKLQDERFSRGAAAAAAAESSVGHGHCIRYVLDGIHKIHRNSFICIKV
jgi:hypothetical protein